MHVSRSTIVRQFAEYEPCTNMIDLDRLAEGKEAYCALASSWFSSYLRVFGRAPSQGWGR